MQINERLKKIRIEKNKNQKEIAEILKTTQQQYQLYESGKRELKANQIITIAKYYNITTDYLLGIMKRDDENE